MGLAALVPIARVALANGVLSLRTPALAAEALLCPLTGVGAWLVWRRVDIGLERKRAALRRWGWVLMLGALWPAALYGAGSPDLATLCQLFCFGLAAWTANAFRKLRPAAAVLLLPYTVWIATGAVLGVARFCSSGF